LLESLALGAAELLHWQDVSRRMYVLIAPDGVISQFEGYRELPELDWDDYRRRYGDIQRLDRILEAEGRSVDDYQASKQADVLMLFYLLSADELRELLGRLDYALPPEAIPRTIEYYLARTSHGSTLSVLVEAWVLARGNREQALEHFERALHSDVADIQGGTTAEGIHLGAMAGCVDLLQRCFAGLETRQDALWFNPHWPRRFGRLEFAVQYRGQSLTVRVSGRAVRVRSEPGPGTIQPGSWRSRRCTAGGVCNPQVRLHGAGEQDNGLRVGFGGPDDLQMPVGHTLVATDAAVGHRPVDARGDPQPAAPVLGGEHRVQSGEVRPRHVHEPALAHRCRPAGGVGEPQPAAQDAPPKVERDPVEQHTDPDRSTHSPSSTANRRSSQFGRFTALSFSTTWPPMSSRSRL
jgi:hypothetical protein